ncbi:transposase [Ktedonobacter sp. SOSP1-52]|uniref:transposase n=1 Tax=Ktedonobacter sp. SOSP1-52 TaxID=2778366 RepID=UPI001915B632|nr:transposase [Ktedonobacter sp. SOSP1-52]
MIGPLQESTSWQAQAGEGYGLYDFEVDWPHQRIRCPQGHLSQRWAPFFDRHGTEKIEVRFPPKMCQACVAREHCTTGAKGRILKLLLQEAYQALEKRREEQHTPAFKEKYALRAGVEGTISQVVRQTRMRRAPLSWRAENASASCTDCGWDQCAADRYLSSCARSRKLFSP